MYHIYKVMKSSDDLGHTDLFLNVRKESLKSRGNKKVNIKP